MRNRWRIRLSGLLCVALFAIPSVGKEYLLTQESDVESIGKSLKAGDALVLRNGVWSGAKLKFERLQGTKDAPIQIRPESQIFRTHSTPISTDWTSNLHQPGKQNSERPVEFATQLLGLERSDDGLLRPTRLDAIRTSTDSAVRMDLDGFARTEHALAGCDDPTTQKRILPSPDSTGPTWRPPAD